MKFDNSAMRPAILSSAALVLSLISAWSHGADFRDASWGMSLSDITTLHENQVPADRRIGYIAFDGKLAGMDVYVFYRFDEEGALFQAGYEILTDEDDTRSAVSAYERLNGLLRQRYPESAEPGQIWRNKLFEAKPDEWGRAVRIGHMSYAWTHNVPRTSITHTLSGNRREISHKLLYEAAIEEADQGVLDQL